MKFCAHYMYRPIAIYRDNLQYRAALTQQITSRLAARNDACLV